MGLSGMFIATCKICGSKFEWHLKDVPFINAEIEGTCHECLNKIDHEIIDERYMPTLAIGTIEFREDGIYITHYEGEFANIPLKVKTKT